MTEQTDVLIVGAGVAGALMAWSLADAGARVTIVEAGPHVDRGVAVQTASNVLGRQGAGGAL